MCVCAGVAAAGSSVMSCVGCVRNAHSCASVSLTLMLVPDWETLNAAVDETEWSRPRLIVPQCTLYLTARHGRLRLLAFVEHRHRA